MGIALPPKIDVSALNFRNERRRSHRAHSLSPLRRVWPAAHGSVDKDEFTDCIWILRVQLRNSFVLFERYLPFALSPFNCRSQTGNISVARRQTSRGIELLKSLLIILIHPVDALTKGKMRFCQIGSETKGNLSLGASFRFPIVGGIIVMEDLSANRRKLGVGKRKIRVEGDRLHIKLLRRLVILQQRVGISRDLIRSQIKNVCLRVLRWFRFHPRFLIRAESDAKRLGYFGR